MNNWDDLRDASYEHWQALVDEAAQRRQTRRAMPATIPPWRGGVAALLVGLAARLSPAMVPPLAPEDPVPADGTL
jgi:hypothetical protein